MELIDFSNCQISPRAGAYGGASGLKDGIIYKNSYWMLKYPKTTGSMENVDISYTFSPLSEYIGSHIYDILGYPVHDTLLGVDGNKVVVACKDFTQNTGPLLEMRTIMNRGNSKVQELLEYSSSDSEKGHLADIHKIALHLKQNDLFANVSGVLERFYDQMIIDIFINNNDRNNGNWGLLYDESKKRRILAPIYDNGAAFNNKISDERITQRMSNLEKATMNAMNIRTAYGEDGKQIWARQILSGKLPSEMEHSIRKNIPLIRKKMPEIKEMIESIPKEYKGLYICSSIRKKFMIFEMEVRLEKLLTPVYDKIIEQESQQEKISEESENVLRRVFSK